MPSERHAPSMSTSGTPSAVSLSQYWNAWTKVIDRIPPESTFTTTTQATTNAPTQAGAPVTVRSTSPALWSCGIR